jgi:inner membrane protein
MDSVTQLALGAAVGLAAMGHRTSRVKAAGWGAVCGTLPDLDVLLRAADPILQMTTHRAESHALFYLTLVSPAIATAVAWLHSELDRLRRWWVAVWLALITHPLLDFMTVYGTRLALPFSDHPFGVGSVFIIDPAYTVPLIAGSVAAIRMRDSSRGLRWNAAGLAVSTAYLVWGALAQQHVLSVARGALAAQGIASAEHMATPTPFNSLLWRLVAVTPDHHYEGFYSLLDAKRYLRFDRFDRGRELHEALRDEPSVRRITHFSHGFFKMSEAAGRITITDLRMGQEPTYTFSFVVAERASPLRALSVPEQVVRRPPMARGLAWLWRRALGQDLPPPR